MNECWMCGDGVDRESGRWGHCEDLGINVDGSIAMTSCGWGKPFAPGSGMPFVHLR